MRPSIPAHWPEYLIEAALLALFMLAACVAVVALEHPASPARRAIPRAAARRAVVGLLMGLTAVALIHSPWGQRSGAHMNPGVTLTFLALGRVRPADAAGYVAAQFAGGLAGVLAARAALGRLVSHKRVRHAATVPGRFGLRAAWLGEFAIAFIMMSVVLWSSNDPTAMHYTGLLAGLLIAAFITIEAPLSGMSMNPARTLGSAVPARAFRGLWIYFTAPPLAMLAAAAVYAGIRGGEAVYCAKLDHLARQPCIFDCRIDRMPGRHAPGARAMP
jgi:aquaporin Z